MSKVCIQTTEFKNVPQGTTTKGFRIYDDYGSFYDNTWDNIPESDTDILDKIIEDHGGKSAGDDPIRGLIDWIREEECGVEINGQWYDWDEIKDSF